MDMELLSFIQKDFPLSEKLSREIDALFVKNEYKKGDTFFKEGFSPDKVFFIEEGLARVFYLKDGKDITHLFLQENSFSLPIESIYYQKPTPYSFEALETSIIRSAHYTKLESYLNESRDLERLMRLLLIDVLKQFSDRMYALQFQSATERYASLTKQYPEILLRAPLGTIASFLGITQETLSRIRAQH